MTVLQLGTEVRIAFHGKLMQEDAYDSCGLIVSDHTGYNHYILLQDPAVTVIPVEFSWPPKAHDVWLIDGQLYHCQKNGVGWRIASTGALTIARKMEAVLEESIKPPELLFRYDK